MIKSISINKKKRFKAPKHYNSFENKFIEWIVDTPPSKFKGFLSFNEYHDIVNDIRLTKDGSAKIVDANNELFRGIQNKQKNKLDEFSYSTYIPILRTLKRVSSSKCLLRNRTYRDYFSELNIEKWDDLSKEAQLLAEKIYRFIKNNNQ